MHNRIIRLILIPGLILLVNMACNFPMLSETIKPIPVSTEAFQELEHNLDEAIKEAMETGRIELTITESQITSAIVIELQSNSSSTFLQPQVTLEDGKIIFSATTDQGGVQIPIIVILTATIDGSGKLIYDIQSATAGPLPIPQTPLAILTTQIDQFVNRELNTTGVEYFLETIEIADGVMMIKGSIQR